MSKLNSYFTTEPKIRSCSIVRNRCLYFLEILRYLGYVNEIPLEKAKELFQRYLGICDRTSLKAYFGTQPTISIRKVKKIARYSTGTMSFKAIELAQEVPQKRGYFELLGLAKIEQRGPTWFMILSNNPLVPELFPQHYESSEVSIENFSLSPILQGKECEKTVLEVVSPSGIEAEENYKQTTTYSVRERNLENNRKEITERDEGLRFLEQLKEAKPLDSGPDKAKVRWF